MYTFILIIHVMVVIILTGMILVQRGRSSGLIEAVGGVESIFGTKTNAFFVKATVFLAVLFFITSITLAYLSKSRSRSLLDKESVRKAVSSSKIDVKSEPSSSKNAKEPPQTSKDNEGARK